MRPTVYAENKVWDVGTLRYVPETQPGGDASAANQTTEIARLTSLLTELQLKADLTETQPVSAASLPLPAGASTSALQTTGNTSLSAIDTKTPALGQALAAASTPVVLTAIQQAALTPPAAISGFALEAGHLAAIDTATARIPAQGQALAAASLPVVLTAAQVTTLTPPAAITGFSTEATLALIKAKTDNLDVLLSTRTKPADAQHVIVDSSAAIAVTGPLTDTQLRATPVPVSGTVTTTPPSNASTNVAQLAGTATSVNSGVKDAGTLRVVLATDQPALTNKLLVTPDSVALPANQSVNVNQFGGSAVATGTGASGVGVPRVTVANDSNVIVTPPTLTKGTQAATGFSTQDLKDSGRVNIMWTAEFSPIAVTEALLSMTESRDGAATTTFTTKVVTSGKRLRITSCSLTVENTLGTAVQRAYLRMRFNTAGAATASSPQQAVIVAQASGTVKTIGNNFDDFPDGIEFLGDGTKQIGFTLQAPDWVTASATLKCYVSISAFEY